MQRTAAAVHKNWVLALCCLVQFMVILDVSVVNVALPSIRADLGFSAVDLQWVVSAYTLTFAGFLLLGGRAADLLGHRTVFIAGLAVFALASLAGGLATSQGMLVAARGVQGLGGAIVAPVTLSVLTTTFTEGGERDRALGLWGAMGGVGGAAGGLLGGGLTQLAGWQWVLFINVPIGIGAALAAAHLLRGAQVIPRGERHYDVAGALTVTAGLVLLTFAIVRTDVNGWGSAATLVVGAAGLALLGFFVFLEGRRAQRPLVPLRIFASRTLTAANVVVFFLGSSVFAMWYFVSLYLQEVLGYSAIEAGVAFLPMTVAIIASAQMASRLATRIGPGVVLTGGMTLIATGLLLFSGMSAGGSYAADVLLPGVVTALGIGFSFVPVTITAVSGVRPSEAGLASGLVNTSRQFGGSLGLAVLATIAGRNGADAGGPTTLVAGFQDAFLVGAAFALAGALVAGAVLARRRTPQPAPEPA
ncbi:MAG: MFS transporter [Solirubrobacteraceae bacterium]